MIFQVRISVLEQVRGNSGTKHIPRRPLDLRQEVRVSLSDRMSFVLHGRLFSDPIEALFESLNLSSVNKEVEKMDRCKENPRSLGTVYDFASHSPRLLNWKGREDGSTGLSLRGKRKDLSVRVKDREVDKVGGDSGVFRLGRVCVSIRKTDKM